MEGFRGTIRRACDKHRLPFVPAPGSRTTFRSIAVDGKEIEFTEGFADLHTEVYRRILEGNGFGVDDARPSIETVYRIRTSPVSSSRETSHPIIQAMKETAGR